MSVVTVRGDGTGPELWQAQDQLRSHVRRARTVRQVLEEAGPALTVAVPLDERYCQFLARAAELPDNGFLRDVAARGCVEVDVSRLAGCDPDDEAVVGFEVSWTERESDLLGLDGGFPQVGPRPG